MSNIPHHLGIILDGNRRWAREKKLPVFYGHKKGLETVRKVIQWCKDKGVKTLTLFVLSTENWKRPKVEVAYLIKLLADSFSKKNLKEVHESGIKIKVIGQRERFSKSLQDKIKEIEEWTKNNEVMTVNFALSYGGRAEIVEAFKKIIKKQIPAEKITEDIIKENLWTSDVDLIIRTGKEQRTSGFLLWQSAYSELYFSKKYWPEFTEQDLDEALADYANRQRRFGK